MPVEHFASKEKYRKNLAYRHIHGIPMTATRVVVGGKGHAVDHSHETLRRKRINAKQKAKNRKASR